MPSPLLAPAAALAAALALPAAATPRVSVDVAPLHAIVATVMAGLGAPDLLVPPGASEHSFSLRPSAAAALDAADLVVWVGPDLTPWLEGPVDALAADARLVTVLDLPALRLAPRRDGGTFEAHDHAGHGAPHPDGEAAAARHAAGHDPQREKGHGPQHETGHAGPGVDPHVWLDPTNAAAIAAAVAEALAEADPANADRYRANAARFAAAAAELSRRTEVRVAPLRGRPFVVFHDAYRYFEDRFDIPAAGSVAASDAEAPTPARVAEIRALVAAAGAVCVFAEPQFDPKLIDTIVEGTDVRRGALDPIGAALVPGPDLYPALIAGLADDLAACLAPPD